MERRCERRSAAGGRGINGRSEKRSDGICGWVVGGVLCTVSCVACVLCCVCCVACCGLWVVLRVAACDGESGNPHGATSLNGEERDTDRQRSRLGQICRSLLQNAWDILLEGYSNLLWARVAAERRVRGVESVRGRVPMSKVVRRTSTCGPWLGCCESETVRH
jgi:hypothetical protein